MDLKTIGTFNLGALVAGVVALIFSFIPSFYRVSVDAAAGFSGSEGVSAWKEWGVLGMLLVILAVAVVALKAFKVAGVPAGLPLTLVAVVAAALGLLFLVICALTVGPEVPAFVDDSSVSMGIGWSGYIVLLATLALVVFTALSFKDSGEKVSDFNRGGHNPPPAGPPAP